jgi:hypothetical protein
MGFAARWEGICDDGSVKYRLVFNFRRRSISLLDEAINLRTVRAPRLLAQLLWFAVP